MKNTKRALLMSVLSMLLCIAMLAGSTFAWFTDSVTSGKNTIVAGNLDIGLYYKNFDIDQIGTGDDMPAVGEKTNIFDEKALWEPGRVEIVTLKVVNEGTLALKYALGINKAAFNEGLRVLTPSEYDKLTPEEKAGYAAVKETVEGKEVIKEYRKSIDLADYLKFAIVDAEKPILSREAVYELEEVKNAEWISKLALSGEGVLYPSGTPELDENGEPLTTDDGKTVFKKSEKIVNLIVFMPEDVGNEANYRMNKDDMDKYNKLVADKVPDDNKELVDLKEKYIPTIDLGVNVFATQYTYEKDSFNDQYDVDAPLPELKADEIFKSLDNGGTLTVSSGVTMPCENDTESRTTIKTVADKTTTLNLEEGANIGFKYQGGNTKVYNNIAPFYVSGNGVFNVNADDAAVVNSDFYDFQVGSKTGEDNPTVEINGGHYIGYSIVNVVSGKVVINGGTFEPGTKTYVGEDNKKYDIGHFLLNCIDDQYKAGKAAIVVKGGTFVGFNPADNKAEGEHTNFVADGYVAVKTGVTSENNSRGTAVDVYKVMTPEEAREQYPEATQYPGKTDLN